MNKFEYIEIVINEALDVLRKNIKNDQNMSDELKSDFEIIQDIESYIDNGEFGLAFECLIDLIESSNIPLNGSLLYKIICISIMMNCSVIVENEKCVLNCI